jgi:hypothetical protein
MNMKKIFVISIVFLSIFVGSFKTSYAQQTRVTYAGNAGKERFNAISELSDGTVLVAGGADNLDWIPSSVSKTQIAATGINNTQGTNRFGFLLRLSGNLNTILSVIHFPANAVEEINFIKTTNVPGTPTGQVYISGKTNDSRANGGGYFIAKLNNNFVSGMPTAVEWVKNVWATGDHQTNQPWDVGGDGKVVYTMGQPYGADWAAVQRLKADGTNDVVENWRYHFGTLTATGANTEGGWTPASSRTEVSVTQSAIVFKAGSRCDMRSWTTQDYTSVIADGNGATKQGKFPLDAFYNAPCNPAIPSSTTSGPGYTGYNIGANPTQRIGGITVDRRNNHFYIGFSIQSRLPSGLPDFEPAVIGMDDTGLMKWWSRLYRETTANSTPDQYVDGVAIDYSKPAVTTELTVLGRSHGNNVINLWSGNSISATQNPANPGSSFHNGFTGTSGNIHISWLGKLRVDDGTLMYSTYNAEYVDGSTNFGTPYSEAIHDGWASHNSGWADLNTTRCKTDVKLDLSGRVYLSCVGRRTVTTANAFQKMLKFGQGASSWNSYVRVYEPDLKTLTYSSILTGTWNSTTGAGGDNTDLLGIFPTNNGVFAVGFHKADATTGIANGNSMPTASVPTWGSSTPNSESAILAKFSFSNSAISRNKFADFDGDGKTDLSVFRASEGNWYLQRSTAGFGVVNFGISTDTITPADIDGDGKTDEVVFRPSATAGDSDFLALRSSTNTIAGVEWGTIDDTPVVADYDGDNKDDFAIWRPTTGDFYVLQSAANSLRHYKFGKTGDKPVPADYSGDNRADFAVYRNGTWYIADNVTNTVTVTNWGNATDIPVFADFDGDGKDDSAVFRSDTGTWYIANSSGGTMVIPFGISGDLPVPGDYDGDGKYDIAVYRNGQWFINNSSNGATVINNFGVATDKAISRSYMP